MSPTGSALRYTELVRMLAQREFTGRYRGNLLGMSLALLVPAAFLLVYTFVFSTLLPMQVRPGASRTDYGFFLFAGLVGWNLFADTTVRAPRLYSGSANLVRRSLMPLSVLPIASACASFLTGLVWLAVFVGIRASTGTLPTLEVLIAPFALFGVAVLAAGAALTLAATGALLRDLAELIQPALSLGFFVSPVLYPASRLAESSDWLVRANPMAGLIETLRASLLGEAWPAPDLLLGTFLWPCAALALGVVVHRKAHRQLVDRL